MLVALSVRKLKPGAYDDFRKAWEPDEYPSQLQRVFHIRRVGDPDEVVSFGFLAGDAADLESIRDEIGEQDEKRQQAMAEHVDEVIVDALYEVIEEIELDAR